ncbi:MAG: hypothetical protein ACPG7F_13005, partial [Aggregatilineales bacterium]
MRPGFLFFLSLLLLLMSPPGQSQVQPAPTTAPAVSTNIRNQAVRSERLGIAFISSAQNPADDTRYNNALSIGAGWTRWPLYWNEVEPTPQNFDWQGYDALVSDDLRYGLNINAILLGKPANYADGASIAGLDEPIFIDGTDFAAPGKAINPNNPWARFVFESVNRYKPGGVLSQQRAWLPDQGIRVWEVWNEPDHTLFWQAGSRAYVRLLKVAYIAAHQADPDTTVMFGGLLYPTPNNFLAAVLNDIIDDPLHEANNWFMDAIAVHSYSYPRRTGWLVRFV